MSDLFGESPILSAVSIASKMPFRQFSGGKFVILLLYQKRLVD